MPDVAFLQTNIKYVQTSMQLMQTIFKIFSAEKNSGTSLKHHCTASVAASQDLDVKVSDEDRELESYDEGGRSSQTQPVAAVPTFSLYNDEKEKTSLTSSAKELHEDEEAAEGQVNIKE